MSGQIWDHKPGFVQAIKLDSDNVIGHAEGVPDEHDQISRCLAYKDQLEISFFALGAAIAKEACSCPDVSYSRHHLHCGRCRLVAMFSEERRKLKKLKENLHE